MSPFAFARRAAGAVARRVRFRRFVARLRRELRTHGARLVLDAPEGARLEAVPRIDVRPDGEGDATFTLRVGHYVRIGPDLRLEIWAGGTNTLELGDGCSLLHDVQLQLHAGAIRLGHGAAVREHCVLKSAGELALGRHTILGHGVLLHCEERLELHDHVGLAERVTILDSDHVLDGSDTWFMSQPVRVAPTVLERNVFAAANAVITRGARIGPNAVVGANAVVRGGEHPGGWLIAGAPARAVTPLSRAVAATDAG